MEPGTTNFGPTDAAASPGTLSLTATDPIGRPATRLALARAGSVVQLAASWLDLLLFVEAELNEDGRFR